MCITFFSKICLYIYIYIYCPHFSEFTNYKLTVLSTRRKNILDKIGSLIPGYTGYSERSDKRKSEKCFRDQNALLLEKSEKNIIEFQKLLLLQNNTSLMKEWETLRKQINTMTSVLKYANYGESSFFSATQIKENELDQIMNFDEQIADRVQLIFKATENELSEDLTKLFITNCLKEIDSSFLNRSNFISKYK